ncbi:MAG TPA: hypothetical protein VHY22_05495 [Chthoniobacteraceae bacterium]|jgi:hypothetical protein|nr:hypothetical protein [Chthoniobacteraceae bacterium]
MSAWIATFHFTVGITKTDGIDLMCRVTIPFIPQKGMMMAVFKGDDLHEVGDVMWYAGNPFNIDVFFKEEALFGKHLLSGALKLGWMEGV